MAQVVEADYGEFGAMECRTEGTRHYIRPLDFPPYSPDLNPIENLWADMDKRMASKPAASKEELEN